jgi:hypothetical protein
MKHLLGSLFLILGLTVSVAPAAKASTEGCPNSWVIDTSSFAGIQELELVKQKLGSNMALSEPRREYTDWSGQLGPMPAPEYKSRVAGDQFLYGKTKRIIIYNVQVKDCPGKIEFRFSEAAPERRFIKVAPANYSKSYPDSFVDFTYESSFDACIQRKVQTQMQNFKAQSRLSGNRWQPIRPSWLLNANSSETSNTCGLKSGPSLIALTPNCFWVDDLNQSSYAVFGPSVIIGSKCDFAFTTYVSDSKGEVPYFGVFTLDSAIFNSTITCVKGKATKKVTAFKPKCPTGYKVRM